MRTPTATHKNDKEKKYLGLFQKHLVAGDDPHQNHIARRIQSFCQGNTDTNKENQDVDTKKCLGK